MAEKVPIYDNHIHMSPSGRNVDALLEFQKAGGTGLTLVTLPHPEVPIACGGDFMESYGITLDLAARARERTDLEINIAVGPYPVLIVQLAAAYGLEAAVSMMMKGMEDAASLVDSGQAQAIGEVGRPHFETSPEIAEASDRILLRGMELARENGCPVIVHCENSEGTNESLARIAGKAGLDPGRVIKHSSPPLILPEENFGVMPSIPASKVYISEALSKGSRFMLETDYIDDPSKPGAVMSVNTVPKKIKGMLASGAVDPETVFRICGEIPDSMYGRR
ncbi:MAG: TatD family hydrolase [Candidatus Methanomethylophilaceae archaeon]|jgi:TatD-related deoxyribonuclease|nr:TatD family hydrolase [Candidatus Methanomethylophilaceae archaeon]NLF33385.1 metal-dependent hydrolase [Thermoplasmatales archaeon]